MGLPTVSDAPAQANWDQLLAALDEFPSLPTLPDVALRLRHHLESMEPNMARVREVALVDPAMAVLVMREAARQPWEGCTAPCSIHKALTTLTSEQLLDLAHDLSPSGPMDPWIAADADPRLLWRHALSTALLAKSLELRKRLVGPGAPDMYLAGLVHNVGWLVLHMAMPEQVLDAIRRGREVARWSLQHEREIFGIDHAELGARLLERWGLPASVVDMVRFHHDPDRAGMHPRHTALLTVSAAMAPHRFPMEPVLENVPTRMPHRLDKARGPAGVRAMEERYSAERQQVQTQVQLMLGWL